MGKITGVSGPFFENLRIDVLNSGQNVNGFHKCNQGRHKRTSNKFFLEEEIFFFEPLQLSE